VRDERPLRFGEALGLGIPLALGGVLTTAAFGGCVWAAAHLGGALVDALARSRSSARPLLALSALLTSLLAGWLGTGLARLDPLRRWVAVGLTLAIALAVGWGALGPTSLVGPITASALAFALAAPGVDRWFEPGAVAARGVSIGPFVAAVAGLELVLGALVCLTASFAKMFAEVGETADGPTEVLFAVRARGPARRLARAAPPPRQRPAPVAPPSPRAPGGRGGRAADVRRARARRRAAAPGLQPAVAAGLEALSAT
jgi:hypothetical protein